MAAQIGYESTMELDTVQHFQDVSENLRKDFEELLFLRQLVTQLETLEPNAGACIDEALLRLHEFDRIIVTVSAQPDKIVAPPACGILGEKTLRARFGMQFASGRCCSMILDNLQNVHNRSKDAHEAAKHIQEPCHEIADAVRGCRDGISATLQNCETLHIGVGSLASQSRPITSSAPFREKLDLGTLDRNMQKLASLPSDLEHMTSTILKKIGMIQSFTDMARTEVTEAFQLPSPLQFAQSFLIGESPPFKRMLLRKLDLFGEIEVCQVCEKLQALVEHVRSLEIPAAQESLRKYVIRASTHLDTLDKLFVAHRRPLPCFVGDGLQGMGCSQPIGIPPTQDVPPAMAKFPTRHQQVLLERVAQPGTRFRDEHCLVDAFAVLTPDISDTVWAQIPPAEEQISAAIKRETSLTWPDDLRLGVTDSVDKTFLNLCPQGEGL